MKIPTSISVLLLSSAIAVAKASQDVCHALVLSGGGNKGAYEAGVVYQLVQSLPASDVTWDVVSGVSAGAMNAAGISIFAVGNEKAMADWLIDLWTTIKTDNIWTLWADGIVHGITQESGIFDDTPLFNLLTEIIDQSPAGIQRKMVVSTVDTQTGTYHQLTEQVPFADLPTAVISSASIPGVFSDRQYQGNVFMDGGTVWNTNLVSAVERCMELVDDKSKIIVDIAICGHTEIAAETETGNALNNILRHRQIKSYYGTMNDVIEYARTEPEVNFRYLLVPSQELLQSQAEMLFFKDGIIQPMIETGKQDVLNVLALGEGRSFEMLNEWTGSKTLQSKYEKFQHYLYSHVSKNE